MSGGHNHTEHGMSMTFHFGYTDTILFDEWKINSIEELVASAFGIGLMGLLYEGIKFYRDNLSLKQELINKSRQRSPWSCMHAYQTILQGLQMILSYFLMLIVMTYNGWLFLAVIIGCTIGYFLFGWKRSTAVDTTECCN